MGVWMDQIAVGTHFEAAPFNGIFTLTQINDIYVLQSIRCVLSRTIVFLPSYPITKEICLLELKGLIMTNVRGHSIALSKVEGEMSHPRHSKTFEMKQEGIWGGG